MIKIIIIIVVVLLVAGGGYFLLRDKPLIQINLPPPASTVSPEGGAPAAPQVSPEVQAPVLPVSGTTVTINNCKADPYLLQVSEGTEITINNDDNQLHTLFVAGPNKEVKLLAKSSAKVIAKFPQGSNFTYNYLCDQQGYPSYGGAIFITP